MADALCGPSNPLQQFQKQSSLDRTLQQDRLSTRQPPSHGFRSRDPLAGQVDADFEAFQAGVPLSELPAYHHPPRPNAFAPTAHTPSWATDFSHMQISQSPAIYQQQHVSMAGPSNANWAQGFREHLSQAAPRAQPSTHSPQAFQHMARYGMSSFHNNYPQTSFAPNVISKGKEPVVEDFDEAAFERAFNQASLDMVAETEAVEETVETQQPAYETGASTANFSSDAQSYMDVQDLSHTLSQDNEARALEDANRAAELERLENEPVVDQDITMLEQEEQIAANAQADDDALAATAKELLEKIQHNQTDKFKNSQFLNLMRKLRDREMRVEGDQMVETVRPIHDSTYGSAAPTPVHLPSSTHTPDIPTHHPLSSSENHAFDHWESPYR